MLYLSTKEFKDKGEKQMKKLVALVLSVVLMISVLPLNVFAMDWDSIVSISFADTYVYDGMQEDGGKFEQFYVKIITTFEDGSTSEEDRIAYRNGGVEVNWGTLYLSDNQDTETWEVGNTYQVTGTVGSFTNTFNVEVRENPIQEISIDDFNVVKSNMCSSEEYGDVYRIRNLLNGCHSCVALYKDGSRTEFSYENLSFGEYYISVDLIVTCDIPYEDWEVGNTYEVTASLLGVADTFNVTVLEIESFEVEDVECIENFDGHMDGYWDENDNYVDNAWFNYNIYPENITVTFTNSLSISGNPSEISEYTGFYPNCYSVQSYENQWGLGNHTATINICGYEQNYTVKVVETPIKDIIIDDITYIEGTNRWNDGPNYYEYYINPETLTVVLKDDTVITGTYNDVCEQLGYYGDCSSDQSYENLWGVGEHKATINLMGYVKEYSINIIKSPISSIEIEDIEILECTHGDYNDKENYMYNSFSPTFSVTFSDGSVKSGLTEGITIDEEYYSLEIRDYTDQYVSPWVVGNTYEIIGSIFGVSDTFNVTIKESPVESLSISDISIVENTNGYIETGFEESYYHYCYFYPDFSVTLKNGDIINSNGSSVEIGGEWYSLSLNDSIQYSEHWTAGNTYEVTGSILGVSDTFNVTITENPIESIVIDDIDVIVNTNGYYDSEYNCYIYSPNPTSFTAILKDGSHIQSVNGVVEIAGEHFGISSYDTNYWSQVENPWTVGNTYQMSASVGGFSDTFNVTITESPVVSIEVEDVTCIEGTRGQYIIDDDGNYYHYEDIYYYIDFVVTLKDGTVLESTWYDEPGGMGNHGVLINGELYDIRNIIDDQDISHWGVGTHTATAELLGATDEFNVTITESPVESVRVEDITVINGIDSYYNGDFDYYNLYPTYTVTFKDGTERTFENGSGITLGGGYYSYLEIHHEQWQTPFEVGNTYQVVGSLGLTTDIFEVTIAENPVKNIEIIKEPDKTEYLVGQYYDLYGMTIRVHYGDETYEDIDIKQHCNGNFNFYISYYSEKLQRYVGLDLPYFYNGFDKTGKQIIEIGMFDKTCELTVDVIENTMESITITEESDKSITIAVTNVDGSSYDMKVLDAEYYNDWAEECVDYVYLFTDKGIFDAKIYIDDNGFAIALGNIASNKIIKSNFVENSEWYEVAKFIHNRLNLPLVMLKNYIQHFNGNVTDDNIDAIIEVAGYINNFWDNGEEIISSTNYYEVYKGESVRKEVLKYFDLDSIDLSLSENYDPTTDTYKFVREGYGGYGFNTPYQISYNDGIWTAQLTLFVEEPGEEQAIVYIKLNDENKIVSFDVDAYYVSQIDIEIPDPVIGDEISDNYTPKINTLPNEDSSELQVFGTWLVSTDGVNFTAVQENEKFEAGKYYAYTIYGSYLPGTDDNTIWLCNNKAYTTKSVIWDGDTVDACYATGALADFICGDLDGDNEVTDWDGVLLARYLAGWNVEITTLDALDIDGDGEITDWDGVVLDRYLAGWNVSIG